MCTTLHRIRTKLLFTVKQLVFLLNVEQHSKPWIFRYVFLKEFIQTLFTKSHQMAKHYIHYSFDRGPFKGLAIIDLKVQFNVTLSKTILLFYIWKNLNMFKSLLSSLLYYSIFVHLCILYPSVYLVLDICTFITDHKQII